MELSVLMLQRMAKDENKTKEQHNKFYRMTQFHIKRSIPSIIHYFIFKCILCNYGRGPRGFLLVSFQQNEFHSSEVMRTKLTSERSLTNDIFMIGRRAGSKVYGISKIFAMLFINGNLFSQLLFLRKSFINRLFCKK